MTYNYMPVNTYEPPLHMLRHIADIRSVCNKTSISDEAKEAECRRLNARLLADLYPTLPPAHKLRAIRTIANLQR